MSMAQSSYPARLNGDLAPALSPGLWLVKLLLLVPHIIALLFLWVAFAVLTVIALIAIIFTGRYPRGIFDFNLGVMRWTWRVGFYGYSVGGTDAYPPFTLGPVPEYPATLTVDHPEQLSRGLALVKWWLLAIPHYIVIAIFLGGGFGSTDMDNTSNPSLIFILVLIALIGLLFTRNYIRSIFDLVMGLNRWVLRVVAYAALMTDAYPPFRLDQGGQDSGPLVAVVEG
jgi:hypothetical protein